MFKWHVSLYTLCNVLYCVIINVFSLVLYQFTQYLNWKSINLWRVCSGILLHTTLFWRVYHLQCWSKQTCYCCVLVGMGRDQCASQAKYQFVKDFANHNCPFWLVGGLGVRAESVDKLEACFHRLHLLQQIWGTRFFSWGLGGQLRRGGWERKVEFCWRCSFLTWDHHRIDYFFPLWHNRCDYCPRAGKTSRVLISSFPLRGWRSGDCICRAGPGKRRGITDWSLKKLEWAVF